MLLASHELDHARAFATREVVITAGQAHLGPVIEPVSDPLSDPSDVTDRGVA